MSAPLFVASDKEGGLVNIDKAGQLLLQDVKIPFLVPYRKPQLLQVMFPIIEPALY